MQAELTRLTSNFPQVSGMNLLVGVRVRNLTRMIGA